MIELRGEKQYRTGDRFTSAGTLPSMASSRNTMSNADVQKRFADIRSI